MLEGKFICTESNHMQLMKVGKIYEFNCGRFIREDDSISSFYDSIENFHFYNTGVEIQQSTPKQLLKSGDKVTYRDGTVRWVLLELGTLHSTSGHPVSRLSLYLDDLNCNDERDNPVYSIVKIERGTELIWERPAEIKTIKMTLTEVATKLGLDENTKLEIEM